MNFLYPIYTWGWISHTSITQPTWGWISRNSCLLECESPIIIELSAWGWISHTMSTSGLISHTCITVYLKVYFLYLRVSFPNVTISTWGWIPYRCDYLHQDGSHIETNYSRVHLITLSSLQCGLDSWLSLHFKQLSFIFVSNSCVYTWVGLTALFPYICFGRSDVQGGSDSFVSKQLFWEVWHPGWVWQLCFKWLTSLFQPADISVSNSRRLHSKQLTSHFYTSVCMLGLVWHYIHAVLNSCVHPWQG